jgi:hypothetical protein
MVMLKKNNFYQHPEHGLIFLYDGMYANPENGRVSNFWYWIVVETKENDCGYGGDWPLHTGRVDVTIKLKWLPDRAPTRTYSFDTSYDAVDPDGYDYVRALF